MFNTWYKLDMFLQKQTAVVLNTETENFVISTTLVNDNFRPF